MSLVTRMVLVAPLVLVAAACSSAAPAPTPSHVSIGRSAHALTDADITPADPLDWPASSSPGYQQAFQGLAHDESNWYLANQCALYKAPLAHDLNDHDAGFLSQYAGNAIPCFGPLWLADGEHPYNCPSEPADPRRYDSGTVWSDASLRAAYVNIDAFPQWTDKTCAVQFKHLGDPAFHGDYLYVPVESVQNQAAIAVFDRNLKLVGMAQLNIAGADGGMTPVASAPFVAVEHDTGLLFTSPYDDAHEIHAFRAELTGALGTGLTLTQVPGRTIYVHYASGDAGHVTRVAGGEFAPDGNLYLAGDELGFQGGLHVVSPSGLHLAWYPVDYEPHKSCTVKDCPEELEGLTFWNVDGRGAPAGGGSMMGQLHLSQNQSYGGVSDDNLWIHHYRVADPLEAATPLPFGATVTTRTPDPGHPDRDLWSFVIDASYLGFVDIRVEGALGLGVHIANAYDPSKTLELPPSSDGTRFEYVGPPVPGTYLMTITGLAAHAAPHISVSLVLPPVAPLGCHATALCDSGVDFTCAPNPDTFVLQRQNASGGWDQIATGASHPPLPDLVDPGVPDAIAVATYRICTKNLSPTVSCADPFAVTINHAFCGGGGDSGGGRTGCVRLSNGKLRCYTTH